METTLKTFRRLVRRESCTYAFASGSSYRAAGDLSASKLSGVNVYNEANDNIGEISDVIISAQGETQGRRHRRRWWHYVLIAMNSLKFSNKAGKTTTEKAPETKRELYPDRAS